MDCCIYTKKTVTNGETFLSREHVIPAFMGGMTRLPKGFVSDSMNRLFSGSLEIDLSKKSILSFIRHVHGPGKRGARDYKSPPFLAEISDAPSFALAQIVNGDARLLPQVFINNIDSSIISFYISNDSDNQELQTQLNELVQLIMSADENTKFVFIKGTFVLPGLYYVTYYDEKYYVAASSRPDNLMVIRNLLAQSTPAEENSGINHFNIPDEIAVEGVFEETDGSNKALLKIDMNVLAYHKGHQYALDEKFDPLRLSVISDKGLAYGDCIYQVDFGLLRSAFDVDEQSHAHVLILRNDGKLEAHASYYNMLFHDVVIADSLDGDDSVCLFICDWKNKREIPESSKAIRDCAYIQLIDQTPVCEVTLLENVLLEKNLFRLYLRDETIELMLKLVSKLPKPVIVVYDTEFNILMNIRFATYSQHPDAFVINININWPIEYIETMLVRALIYFTLLRPHTPCVFPVHPEYGPQSGEAIFSQLVNALLFTPQVDNQSNALGYNTDFLCEYELSDLIDAVINDTSKMLINDDHAHVTKVVQLALILLTAQEKIKRKVELLFKADYSDLLTSASLLIQKIEIIVYHIHDMDDTQIYSFLKEIIKYLKVSEHIKVATPE